MLSFLPSTRHPERSEGSRFKTIVNQLSLNTSRQEGAAAGGSPSLVPAVPPFPPQAVGQQCLTTLSLLPSTVIRGRSADNRKALLNSRCPLRGHRVYEGKNANVAPLLLYAGPTLADLRILGRMRTVRGTVEPNTIKYQSAGSLRLRRIFSLLPLEGRSQQHF